YSGSAMRSSSRSPRSSNRHSSTLVALAEKRAKCVPLPSHAAPQGCGRPSCTTLFLVAFMNLVSLFKFYLDLESLRLLLALHNQETMNAFFPDLIPDYWDLSASPSNGRLRIDSMF